MVPSEVSVLLAYIVMYMPMIIGQNLRLLVPLIYVFVYYCEECNLYVTYYYIGRSVLLVPAALLTPSPVIPSVPFAAGFQTTKALGVLLVPSLS